MRSHYETHRPRPSHRGTTNAASQHASRTMRHTPRAVLRSGHHRQLPRGQAPQQAEGCHHPENRLVLAKYCPQESGHEVHGRTIAVAGL